MNILQDVINVLNWIALNIPWEAIAATGVITALLEPIKKWVKKIFVHYDWVMVLLAGLVSLVVVTVNYLLNDPTYAPKLVPVIAAAMAYGTQPFYKILFKPALTALVGFVTKQVAEARLRSEAQRAAQVPANGIPVVAAPTEDF